MLKKFFYKKQNNELSESDHTELKRTLRLHDLILMGIAAIIGAGIFSTIGKSVYKGGLGVVGLIILIAIICILCAFCYAEFASRIHSSGSAYSYAYITIGEIVAWMVGWSLILEYSFSNGVLAVSWGSYFLNILEGINIHLPKWLSTNYIDALPQDVLNAPHLFNVPIIINLPALIFTCIMSAIVYIGIQESKIVSHVTVIIKLLTISVVIGIGFFYITPSHLSLTPTNILPNGISGVLSSISVIFFTFFGFDSLSSVAEECHNPKKDLPKAMILSVVICAVIYIIITIILQGIVGYENLNVDDPIAYIFSYLNMNAMSYIVSISALFVIASAFIVFQIAQPRIWMSMSRDGLLPPAFGRIHKKYQTPHFSTIITCIIVGTLCMFLNINIIADLSSMGTLFVFIIIAIGVLLLPKNTNKNKNTFSMPYINSKYLTSLITLVIILLLHNDAKQMFSNFSIHLLPQLLFFISLIVLSILSYKKALSLIPVVAIIGCLYLLLQLGISNLVSFGIWLIVGLVIYISYGYRKNNLSV